MRIAIIGRTEVLYDTALQLRDQGHEIALIVTAKESAEYKKTAEDFRALSDACNVPYICTARIKEAIDVIRSLPTIDIGVSMNYSGIIPQSVIDLFHLGILNAHGGDLPRYRGNACQAWAIINGEDRVGLCIHRMIGGELDNGDIVARDYFPLTINTKITEAWGWMEDRIPSLFEESLNALAANPNFIIERQSKNPKDALRCYPRRAEDGCIDWNRSAIEVLRLINASNRPYSGAFCDCKGEKLIIWDAELVDDREPFCAIPGQITAITPDRFAEVATGDGKLLLRLVDYNGTVGHPVGLAVTSLRDRLG